MSNTPAARTPALAGQVPGTLLGFLIPGLGQIYQGSIRKDHGRLAKGILFLVCLWGMFFYGMWLGKWKNVYIPDIADTKDVTIFNRRIKGWAGNVYTRLHYVGQFWIGAAAWPAILQYAYPESPKVKSLFGDYQRALPEDDLNDIQKEPDMGKLWDIAWVYTVIAGVLNLLVIYDAWAGPVNPKQDDQAAPPAGGAA